MNVPNIAFSALDFVISGINHSGSGLDPVTFDHLSSADSGDEDVGFAASVSEVKGFAVGDGDSGVPFKKHESHRFSEDVAAADHEGALAGDIDVVMVKDFGDTERGGTAEAIESSGESSEGGGGDTVGVLLGPEGEESSVFVEVLWEGMLEEDSVDFWV